MQDSVTPDHNVDLIRDLRDRVARHPGDLDAVLMLGSALFNAGDLDGADAVLQSLLRQHPNQTQALLLLARIEAHSGRVAQAQQTLNRATETNPDNPQTWQMAAALAAQARNWAELRRIGTGWTQHHPDTVAAWQALSHGYFEDSDFSASISSFERVLTLDPDNVSHLVSAARIATAASDHQKALRHLSRAESLAPDSGEVLFAAARLHQSMGELALAEDYCVRAIDARPGFAPAYVTLGLLREGQLEASHINTIRLLSQNASLHPEYRAMLSYTLGDALDRQGTCEAAFSAWDQANQISRQLSEQEGFVYRAEEEEEDLALLTEIFSAESILAKTVAGSDNDPQPIFVLGMPRSGTTLVESILACHSTVHGAGELLSLAQIHDELMGVARAQGVEAARQLLHTQAETWRSRYLAALPAANGARFVVDKLPQNFRSVGLIRLLFPQVAVIWTQRDASDVGLSIYRHNFARNWPCAQSLRDIGHYYGIHNRFLSLWQSHYPAAIHVLEHSALVEDPAREIRQLLDFAGLPFEPACLAPHKQKRAVATFSAVQVQKPVSVKYSGRAARYAEQLKKMW